METTKEIWENYFVDTGGNVYSKRRLGAKGGPVKQWLRDGYFYVRIRINKRELYTLLP